MAPSGSENGSDNGSQKSFSENVLKTKMLRKWRQTKLLRKKTLELGKNTKIVNKFISNTDTLHEQTNLDGLEDIIELFDSRNLSQNTLSNLKNSVEEKLNEAKDLLIGLDLGNLPKNGKRQSV